jgi:hypothetical protein
VPALLDMLRPEGRIVEVDPLSSARINAALSHTFPRAARLHAAETCWPRLEQTVLTHSGCAGHLVTPLTVLAGNLLAVPAALDCKSTFPNKLKQGEPAVIPRAIILIFHSVMPRLIEAELITAR